MRREDLHLHDHRSNLSGYHECVCTEEHYAKKIKELGGTALCITNHGTLLGWNKAYAAAHKYGLKYMHACEVYVTQTLDEKIKDNYHCVLIAKNKEGFKELNKLLSPSSLRDNHYYFNARITFEELFATSENIIVLSACLGGVLSKTYREDIESGVEIKDILVGDNNFNKMLKFFIANSNRCYLEIQPHASKEQIEWNIRVKALSDTYGLKVVATLDAHASSEEREETRKVLKKSKGNQYSDEDRYKLYLRSYDEVLEDFIMSETNASFHAVCDGKEVNKITNVLTKEWYEQAIEMSNTIVDDCDEIIIDTSIKYPQMSNDVKEAKNKVVNMIQKGIVDKGYKDSLLPEEKKKYANRIKMELNVWDHFKCYDYFLFEDEFKSFMRKEGIVYGTRGSAAASMNCYLMDITKINPIKSNLDFARFQAIERPGVPDIDTDVEPGRRQEVFDFLLNHDRMNCAHIIAFGTLKLKSAIGTFARGLDIPFGDAQKISKDIDDKGNFANENSWRKEYPELFKHVDRVIEKKNECIVSVSVHPCGILATSEDPESDIGYYYIEDKKTERLQRCITIDMDGVEAFNYLKYDILAVDVYDKLANTCRLIGMDYNKMMPEGLRPIENDFNVWKSMREDTTEIFQMNKAAGSAFFPKLFSDSSLARIKEKSDISYMDLMSFASAAIRPAGNEFRDKVAEGHILDNGHEALNNLLKDTMGAMIYQESIMYFLNQFAGQTLGESYKTIKGISKQRKEVVDKVLPLAKKNLIKYLMDDGYTQERAEKVTEPFIKSLIAAAGYGFNRPHSIFYAYLGYAMGWLRYYHPLEFYTSSLNSVDGDEDKINSLIQSASKRGIQIKKPVFGKSGIGYEMNKEENTIYRGVDTIKFLNETAAVYLKEKQSVDYNSFDEFMLDLFDPERFASMKGIECKDVPKKKALNSKQLAILVNIGFFDNFDGDLLSCIQVFKPDKGSGYDKKQSEKTCMEKYQKSKDALAQDKRLPARERLLAELQYLGSPYLIENAAPTSLFLVSNQIREGWDISYEIYQVKTGRKFRAKVDRSLSFGLKTEMFIKVTKFRNETTPSGSKLIRITEGDVL